MKTSFSLLVLFISIAVGAQCEHNPTVIADMDEGVIMMCPPSTSTMTVSTQAADSYQWFKKETYGGTWAEIAGETHQELVIDYYNYVVNDIKVATTVNGCTEESPAVAIDGWTFLLPSMSIDFGTSEYQQLDYSEYNVCNGGTITLLANQPFIHDISWFNQGNLIEGETQANYAVTQSGDYTFDACTDVCPDWCAISSNNQVPPVLFHFGDWSFCTNMGTFDNSLQKRKTLIYPNPAKSVVHIQLPTIGKSEISLFDNAGKLIRKISQNQNLISLEVSDLPAGMYRIVVLQGEKRFHSNFIKK
ncbi:MAG: T9SS type A sorting domain-containing protein [Flavobacteriaceae bacterium]|nr:T9SS type A sorting domain-containing protein [Flavobacteriaceae bacterium]